MDSPQLLHLALLLLALAAPRPNIAMSIIGPAEGTEDSSTEETVYLCKEYNSSTCKSGKNYFEYFKIIADTQNKIVSNGIRNMVTNETHTTVRFEGPNFCLKEMCSDLFQKRERSGCSCGILSSGEDGRGDLNTEKIVCCEAETGTEKPKCALKCFKDQKPDPDGTTTPAVIHGNPEFLTSKKNSTGILFAFLFVGVCTGWGTMYYCLWLRRRGQAFRQCRQDSDCGIVSLVREPSTREETPLTAASSSFSDCTATS